MWPILPLVHPLGGQVPWALFAPPASGLLAHADAPVAAASSVAVASGTDKPFPPRDPKMDPRLRRFTEIVSSAFVSLMAKGILVQNSGDDWTLDVTAASSSADGLTGTFNSPGVYD